MTVKQDKDIINIEGERNFVRDKNSKAILSRNEDGLKAYKLQRIRMQKVLEYENDKNTLKSEIKDMRTVLDVIVKKLNN